MEIQVHKSTRNDPTNDALDEPLFIV
jgi:hypothetical protein